MAAKKAKKSAAKKKAKAPAKAKAPSKAAKKATPEKAAKPTKAAKPAPAAKKNTTPSKPAPMAAPKKSSGASLENLFTPLDDRVIIEASIDANRTPGGLYIPDTVGASDRPKQGKIVAVGRGHRGKKGRVRPLDVQLGDTVMYETYQASELKIGERQLVILRESQLLGIVK